MKNKQLKTIGKVDVIAPDFIGITYIVNQYDIYTLEVEKLDKCSSFKEGDEIEITVTMEETASNIGRFNYISDDYASFEYSIGDNKVLTLELDNEVFKVDRNNLLVEYNYDLILKVA